jgi:hypothetical protein
MVFGLICKIFASFQHILWPYSNTYWSSFDFSSRPCLRIKKQIYLCSLFCNLKVCLFRSCITFHIHVGTASRSSFHECPTDRKFGFKNIPNIEAFPNASEFFGNTPNIFDNCRVICSEEGRLLLPGFMMESVNWCGYSCFMFLIFRLKSFWSWRMTLALLTKLWTTLLMWWCGQTWM